MNCGDFRYLVQRRFDVELPPQDDRALLIHLETCESCQKFYHQVQQVIIAAEELELSEDLLPQAPDHLFGKILENIPQEKPGIKNLFHSLLELFSFFSKTNKDQGKIQMQGEEGLLPRMSQIANRKRQVSLQPGEFGTARGFGEQVSHPVTSWGQSSPTDAIQDATAEINENAVADQVTTRSLGEKFGLSGANPQLNNKQGLSLAESIKQKISEMSKIKTEHHSVNHYPEPVDETMDEWTVPHSPQWPKLNTDVAPEQWPNQVPGTRAPNAWGTTTVNWGGQDQVSATNNVLNCGAHDNENGGQTANLQPNTQGFNNTSEQIAKPVEQSLQQPPPNYQLTESTKNTGNNWSNAAEQLETGNWQMVQFDTTLGPTGYPLSSPTSPPPPSNNPLPISSQPSLPQTSTSQIPNQPELMPKAPFAQSLVSSVPIQQPSAALDLPLKNFPQLFTGEVISEEALEYVAQPEIKSENAYEISQQSIQYVQQPPPVQVQQPPQITQTSPQKPHITQRNLPTLNLNMEQQTTNNEKQNIQLQNPETGGPRIYPVVSKRVQPTSAIIVDAAFDEGADGVNPSIAPPEVQAKVSNPLPQDAAVFLSVPQVLPQDSAPIYQPNQSAPLPAAPPLPTASTLSTLPTTEPLSTTFEAMDETPPLFKLDDSAIDRIFSNNLGVHESVVPTQSAQLETFENPANQSPQTLIRPSKSAESPQLAATPMITPSELVMNQNASPSNSSGSAPQAPVTTNRSGASSMQSSTGSAPAKSVNNDNEVNNLFAVDDNLIDRIFTDTLGVPEHISKNIVGPSLNNSSAPIKEEKTKSPSLPIEPELDLGQGLSPQPMNNAPKLLPQATADLTNNIGASFGQSNPSAYSSGKQKISGVGKLDSRNEALIDPGSGRIASIGKFLLDNKDLEKIGKITASDLSDSKMRTLTIEANEELKNLLRQIDAQEGVTGTVIVGHDGLLIANTMSLDLDPESLGVWALGVYMGTAHVVEKLGDDNVRQIVSQTNQGYLIIANFGAGLLVTLTSPIMLDKLLPLMRTITQLVAA